jgi:ethanolamine ammonia-lyase large subunit
VPSPEEVTSTFSADILLIIQTFVASMPYRHTIGTRTYQFANLETLLARASPLRAGDMLAGVAAATYEERVAAQYALADVPLRAFLSEALVPYEQDEVTRLIIDTHDVGAFAPLAHFTVGELRDWLVSDAADGTTLAMLSPGLTPEMVAAVSKLLRNQELIAVARRVEVITRFRNTLGLRGHLATRLQPNHPTDDLRGIAASLVDGLLYGSGDAVLGINPATDNVRAVTEAANKSFGIRPSLLQEAWEATLALGRGTLGNNVMYFETGQGSALSANAHYGLDQQTCEARAYAVARHYRPLLVNSVVGFIGPEYLYDGKQIIRAALEDHFCGKLLGLPMGVDVCYTNHAEADQDDMDTLLTLLGVAGCNFIMGVPGADDIMLGYQSTSFHDALYLRRVLGLRPAPEFAVWLTQQGIFDEGGRQLPAIATRLLRQLPPALRT